MHSLAISVPKDIQLKFGFGQNLQALGWSIPFQILALKEALDLNLIPEILKCRKDSPKQKIRSIPSFHICFDG